jgi:hypothetical protein
MKMDGPMEDRRAADGAAARAVTRTGTVIGIADMLVLVGRLTLIGVDVRVRMGFGGRSDDRCDSGRVQPRNCERHDDNGA